VLVGIYLPAIYICAQLFKIQLLPVKLLFQIASSVSGIPLSPSVEMFFTLFVLEVLIEASIRMPKYVGLAMSVVGALVLGDTAVKAGIISTPAIIIVAFSAICLYTVPDLIETTTTLRLLFLIVAGSIGTFGVVLLSAFLLSYIVTEQDYGVPLFAPFSPLVTNDLYDSLYKSNMYSLGVRPKVLNAKNRVRLKVKDEKRR
jgi:spore germination protein KA